MLGQLSRGGGGKMKIIQNENKMKGKMKRRFIVAESILKLPENSEISRNF